MISLFALSANAESISQQFVNNLPSLVSAPFVVALNVPPRETTDPNILCSCINFAKWFLQGTAYTGIAWGNARDLKPDHFSPHLKDVIVFKNHVGVVTSYDNESVYFSESNWIHCKASERKLNLSDPSIIGYLRAPSAQ